MYRLERTDTASIVYDEYGDEMFRCPQTLEHVDLRTFVNTERCFLGFEADTETNDLKKSEKYLGYYRLYFRNGNWYGSWIETDSRIDRGVCAGVDNILDWLYEEFPEGCNSKMEKYLTQYPNWQGSHRYLLKPLYSDKYKVMFNTEFGNHDYPVRIYVYE